MAEHQALWGDPTIQGSKISTGPRQATALPCCSSAVGCVVPAKADTEGSFFPNCHFFCDCFEHRTKEHGKNSASPVRDGVEKAEKKKKAEGRMR